MGPMGYQQRLVPASQRSLLRAGGEGQWRYELLLRGPDPLPDGHPGRPPALADQRLESRRRQRLLPVPRPRLAMSARSQEAAAPRPTEARNVATGEAAAALQRRLESRR